MYSQKKNPSFTIANELKDLKQKKEELKQKEEELKQKKEELKQKEEKVKQQIEELKKKTTKRIMPLKKNAKSKVTKRKQPMSYNKQMRIKKMRIKNEKKQIIDKIKEDLLSKYKPYELNFDSFKIPNEKISDEIRQELQNLTLRIKTQHNKIKYYKNSVEQLVYLSPKMDDSIFVILPLEDEKNYLLEVNLNDLETKYPAYRILIDHIFDVYHNLNNDTLEEIINDIKKKSKYVINYHVKDSTIYYTQISILQH